MTIVERLGRGVPLKSLLRSSEETITQLLHPVSGGLLDLTKSEVFSTIVERLKLESPLELLGPLRSDWLIIAAQ